MTDGDRATFAAELTLLAEVFGETLSRTRIGAYFVALEDFEFSEVQGAMRRAIKTSKFFPKPAEVAELIGGSLDDRAAFQWAQVMLAIRGKPCEVDAVAHEAVRLMGGWRNAVNWLNMIHATHRDEENQRKQFLQLYRVAARRQQGTSMALGVGVTRALESAPAPDAEGGGTR